MNEFIREVKRRIELLSGSKKRILIAIDGRCASGKTTLANALEKELGCAVFHMDDFFLRPEQRSAERLGTPGENVDHERFYEEVLAPLCRGEDRIVYRAFDCSRKELTAPHSADVGGIVLVEGSYSCHPALWEHYDLHIFLSVSPAEQMNRIIKREGAGRAVTFKERWIPMEESYFNAYRIEERCELRFVSGQQEPQNA